MSRETALLADFNKNKNIWRNWTHTEDFVQQFVPYFFYGKSKQNYYSAINWAPWSTPLRRCLTILLVIENL